MSYDPIKTKLENNKIIILDGGMGAELEKNGAEMDKHMWCGKCSVDHPELVRKVHEDYINGQATDTGMPFGGYKQSGNGREGGVWGFTEFLEVKAITGWN